MTVLASCMFAICSAVLLMASLHDVAARTVPNAMAAILALAGLAGAAIEGYLPGSVLAGLGVFAVGALCWRRGWLGGADVKLLAAACVALPPASILQFISAVAIAGGGLALFYLGAGPLARKRRSHQPHGLLARVLRVERWRIGRGGPLPYACAIAAGFLYVTL